MKQTIVILFFFLLILGACNSGQLDTEQVLSANEIHLTIGDAELAILETKAEAAIAAGVLIKTDEDWVPITLKTENGIMNGTLRLKGDWADHLQGNKWSYRVKTDKNNSWNGMKTFSLQHPKRRNYLSEWFYHEWLRSEDVLTTNYGFINLNLNGKSKGIYAYEEHFEKHLLANNNRREGIILKFNEEGIWDARYNYKKGGPNFEPYLNSIVTSPIEAFGQKDVLKSEALSEQFSIASTLLIQLRNKTADYEEVFDLDKMAKFLAICDINKAYHGIVWHNLRFYYNPISSKLEPLGFDAFMDSGPLDWVKKPFFGWRVNEVELKKKSSGNFWGPLMVNEAFVAKYVTYLEEFSNQQYIDSLFSHYQVDIDKYEGQFKKEFSKSEFDKGKIWNRAAITHNALYPKKDSEPAVYVHELAGGIFNYDIRNFHALPVIPYGIGDKQSRVLLYLKDAQHVGAHNPKYPSTPLNLELNIEGDWFFYQVPGLDSVFSVKMFEYEAPAAFTPLQLAQADYSIENNPIFLIEDKTIFVKPGKHVVKEVIAIPANYTVEIIAGTQFDLIEGGAFVSESPVNAHGEDDNPIVFTSSDGNNNGFVLLGNGEACTFNYVHFNNLQTTSIRNWTLTGSVTVYNSKVSLKNCLFSNNNSEDALNLINSSIDVSHCSFKKVFADALDADFCSGYIEFSKFDEVGNDCIDVSGSNVHISSCQISNCKDKAVSIGERSTAKLYNLTITNAVTGVAAKDLSKVTGELLKIEDCMFGFSAYQKKPEFGGANIQVKNVEFTQVEKEQSKDEQSEIEIKK